MLDKKSKIYKTLILILGLGLVLSAAVTILLVQKRGNWASNNEKTDTEVIKKVSANDIYSLFRCPCCGKPLDPQNICCGMAKERIDHIDSLVAQNLSENEIILAYVKKYGLNSFVDKNKTKELKEELTKTAPAERPVISLTPASYDLGNVSQKKGEVFTSFEIKNEGKSDLIIDKLDTSCGCTSASIVFKDTEGPRFAMTGHGYQNPTDWQVSIPPGENAQLKVYYDPNVHKDFRGPATREVYVYSNDPVDFEKKITVELNQVD